MYNPLRYSITSWYMLPQCMSNNSRKLHLVVSDILNDSRLSGTLIQLKHEDFGVLFACIVNGSGTLINYQDKSLIPELSTYQILTELSKYGFLIEYTENTNLSGDQIQYLLTLDQLGYDKIALCSVHSSSRDEDKIDRYVTAFIVSDNPKWLNNTYVVPRSEYSEALIKGTAINLTNISITKKFKWNWLNYVANISDIIEGNR